VTVAAPHVDLLTGTWKKRHFEGEFSKAVSEAQRFQRPLCLIHLDVDDLQEHNDTHGQEALDVSLGWLALVISKIIDGRGPIGRVGGDEFAVFLARCTLERAQRLAEQIREVVPRTVHTSDAGTYRLTVSAGVAALRPGEPWGNLVQAAEEACLKAKQGGRDSVASR
jgi:diguanylate cyclase (GGDEF)-like protein